MTVQDGGTGKAVASDEAATGLTGAEALVAQLESYGVDYVFGLCGHTNIALLDALSRSRIDFVVFRHEQTAAHAADGYARATGRPGVVVTHVGPGMMNAVTGVASAALDSVPLVVISGDVPSYYHGRHPHQEVNLHADADQTAIYAPFVKRTWKVNRVEDLSRFTERAFWTATSGRSGAVLLNVPMDIFSRRVSSDWSVPPLTAPAAAGGIPDPVASEVATALAHAERPLIYVGGGLSRGAGVAALTRLAEHLEIPVVHSLMAKGLLPDDHPLVMGMPGFWGLEFTNRYCREADVVLAVGTRFAETDASSWDPRFTWRFPPSRLYQIDIDADEIGRNYPVELGIVADATAALSAISEAAMKLTANGRASEIHTANAESRSRVFDRVASFGDDPQMPMRPERILADLGTVLPADAVLVTDVGWNKNGVAQCYRLPEQGRFITPGGSSTMGFGPAAALGVQMGWPERTVVALIGDGGMSAQLAALPTSVERDLPVIFVVMNNAAHGTIADLQTANFGTGYGCEFVDRAGNPYSPDFAALGRAVGTDGYTVTAAEELRKHLSSAIAARRPAVIDVPMLNEPVPTPGHWNITDIYGETFEGPPGQAGAANVH